MTMQTHQPPPLLTLQSDSVTALEALLFKSPVGMVDDSITAATKRHAQAGADYNRYVFSQLLMVLYIRIFDTPSTSFIYRDIIDNVIHAILKAYSQRAITDLALLELLRVYFVDRELPPQGRHFTNELARVRSRVQPEDTAPGIDDLFRIVHLIYDNRPSTTRVASLYRILLRKIEGYDAPTLVLVPVPFCGLITIDTTNYVNVTNPYWKFLFSLRWEHNIKMGGDFTVVFRILASLALPLDPIDLTRTMSQQLSHTDNRFGIPFLNYLAMYLRQRELGFNYTLSHLANSRRILMYRLHQFCGVGAVGIRDLSSAQYFLKALLECIEASAERFTYSDEDRDIIRYLMRVVDIEGTEAKLALTQPLRYESAFEAAKSGDKDDNGAFASDKGAFDNNKDPDASAADLDNNPPDSSETGDDNIDQTGGGQSAPAQSVSAILPLALPSETIDDHLYRLSVLQYVSHLDQTPDLDIAPDSLSMLKTWCESWLFLAATQATKKLLAQLKLTGHLKEFASE